MRACGGRGSAAREGVLDAFAALCPQLADTYRFIPVQTARFPREIPSFTAPSLCRVAHKASPSTFVGVSVEHTSAGAMTVQFDSTSLELAFFPVGVGVWSEG